MPRQCSICGKRTMKGNNTPRKGLSKKKGGAGQHIGVTTKRSFKPNIVKIKTILKNKIQTVKICTHCLKANKVRKVV